VISIAEVFNKQFSTWDIVLPEEDLLNKRRGKIEQRGWSIWYVLGTDELGEYLDYYSYHRMGGDDHTRIRAGGVKEDLPAVASFRACSENSEEDACLEKEFFAKNLAISKMLDAKGFGFDAEESSNATINRGLNTGSLK
jgi:hypothetical protein